MIRKLSNISTWSFLKPRTIQTNQASVCTQIDYINIHNSYLKNICQAVETKGVCTRVREKGTASFTKNLIKKIKKKKQQQKKEKEIEKSK